MWKVNYYVIVILFSRLYIISLFLQFQYYNFVENVGIKKILEVYYVGDEDVLANLI